MCSAVNMAEVHGKLLSQGWSSEEAWEDGGSAGRLAMVIEVEKARSAKLPFKHTPPAA